MLMADGDDDDFIVEGTVQNILHELNISSSFLFECFSKRNMLEISLIYPSTI